MIETDPEPMTAGSIPPLENSKVPFAVSKCRALYQRGRLASLVLAAALWGGCTKADPGDQARAAFKAGDYARALALAQPAAEAGNPGAQTVLGLMLAQGKGVKEDIPEAVKWFRKAADQGYPLAQFDMGMMAEMGSGVPQDPVEACKWYALAAAQGDAESAKNLKELESELKPDQLAEAKKRAAAFKNK
jgi:TPR repeat protein